METTLELPDELLEQVRRVARRVVRRHLGFPTYGGSGLTTEFQGVAWSWIRDEVYREHGA